MIDFEAEKRKIEQVLMEIIDAQDRKDMDGVLAHVTDDPLMLRPNRPLIRGLDAWRQDYKRYFKTSISETATPLKVEIASCGEMAWEYGVYHGTSKSPEGPVSFQGKYLSVYEKVNGEWRLAVVSLSPGEQE